MWDIFQVTNKDVILVSVYLLWIYSTAFFSAFIVDFERAFVFWILLVCIDRAIGNFWFHFAIWGKRWNWLTSVEIKLILYL